MLVALPDVPGSDHVVTTLVGIVQALPVSSSESLT
jgi:hypothetical protein